MHRAFNINGVVPPFIRPLAMLATPERLTIDNQRRQVRANDPRLSQYLRFARDHHGVSSMAMLLRAQRLILTQGPRVFRPTYQQCLAVEQVEVGVPLRDYRQPYEVMLIDLPSEYATARGAESPYLVYRSHDALFGYLLIPPSGEIYFFLSDANRVLEETLSDIAGDLDQERVRRVRLVERVVMNCCLLLTPYAHRLVDLGSRSAFRENQRRRRRRGDATPLRMPQEIRLVQHIDFHVEDRVLPSATQGGTGDSVQPHWRKGHWRRQAFGAGWTQQRLICIRPVLVNAHLDNAAPAERQAIYYGRDEQRGG